MENIFTKLLKHSGILGAKALFNLKQGYGVAKAKVKVHLRGNSRDDCLEQRFMQTNVVTQSYPHHNMTNKLGGHHWACAGGHVWIRHVLPGNSKGSRLLAAGWRGNSSCVYLTVVDKWVCTLADQITTRRMLVLSDNILFCLSAMTVTLNVYFDLG